MQRGLNEHSSSRRIKYIGLLDGLRFGLEDPNIRKSAKVARNNILQLLQLALACYMWSFYWRFCVHVKENMLFYLDLLFGPSLLQ